jgi:hypothetical protein
MTREEVEEVRSAKSEVRMSREKNEPVRGDLNLSQDLRNPLDKI